MKFLTLGIFTLLPVMAIAQTDLERTLYGITAAEVEAKADVVISKAYAQDPERNVIRVANQRNAETVIACYVKVRQNDTENQCEELARSVECLTANPFAASTNLGAFYSLAGKILVAASEKGKACSVPLAILKQQKSAVTIWQMEQAGNPNKIVIVPVGYNVKVLNSDMPAFTVRDLTPLGLQFLPSNTHSATLPFSSVKVFGLGHMTDAQKNTSSISYSGKFWPIQAQLPGSVIGSKRPMETIQIEGVLGTFIMPALGRKIEAAVSLSSASIAEARFTTMEPAAISEITRYISSNFRN